MSGGDVVLGSAGCQPAAFGSLPNAFRNAKTEAYANGFAASCRELQAGSLYSPDSVITLGFLWLSDDQRRQVRLLNQFAHLGDIFLRDLRPFLQLLVELAT